MALPLEKPKVLVLRKAKPGPDALWTRVVKALGAFCELAVEGHASLPQTSLVNTPYDHVFVDVALGDVGSLPRSGRCTLVFTEAFTETTELATAMAEMPVFSLQDLAATDMVRFLYVYLCPKRLAGVTALSDKSSVVVGEKIQNVNTVGTLADKAANYLSQLDGFTLSDRLRDLRLVLPAILFEAFRCVEATRKDFPAVDFQFSASANRIAINLRFEHGGFDLAAMLEDIRTGGSLTWRQIWECSDQLLVSEHRMHKEIELSVLLHQPQRRPAGTPRTLLYRTLQKSARKEDYLDPPDGYQFQILSEIRQRELESVENEEISADELENGIDFGALPEATARKIRELLKHSHKLEEDLAYKESQLLRSQERTVELERTVSHKRAEVLQVRKQQEGEAIAFDKAMKELQRQIKALERNVPSASAQAAATSFDSAELALREKISKLDFQVKTAEERCARLQEDLRKEGRVVSLLEGRLKTSNQEVKKRDDDIYELRATIVSLRSHTERAAAKLADNGPTASSVGLEKKVKDMEERAVNAEKEVRGLKLKVESTEKNAKVVQEKADKEKNMMEEKLKQAKAKEVELRKKIDDLTAILKKAKVA